MHVGSYQMGSQSLAQLIRSWYSYEVDKRCVESTNVASVAEAVLYKLISLCYVWGSIDAAKSSSQRTHSSNMQHEATWFLFRDVVKQHELTRVAGEFRNE